MGIGKSHTFRSELVDSGRWNLGFSVVAARIPIPHIVHKNYYDIGLRGQWGSANQQGGGKEDSEYGECAGMPRVDHSQSLPASLEIVISNTADYLME